MEEVKEETKQTKEPEAETEPAAEENSSEQILYLCYCYLKDRGLLEDFESYIGTPKETPKEKPNK